MTDLQAKFTEFFTQIYQSINFEFIIKFVIVYFFLIWISLVVWVLKDIRNRTTNVFFQIFCLIVAVIPFFGIFVYLLFRHSRTLYEKYYEEIEENLDIINEIIEERKKQFETKINKSIEEERKKTKLNKINFSYKTIVKEEPKKEIKVEKKLEKNSDYKTADKEIRITQIKKRSF